MSQDPMQEYRFSVEWLDSLGYGALDQPQKHLLLNVAYSAFEEKVGLALSRSLPDELLGQFESIVKHPHRHVADTLSVKFLQDNIPGYRDTVQTTYQQLVDELLQIRTDFDELLRSRGRARGSESHQVEVAKSHLSGVSEMEYMESTDDAPSGSVSADPQVDGGPEL